jgi:hypothetical protein
MEVPARDPEHDNDQAVQVASLESLRFVGGIAEDRNERRPDPQDDSRDRIHHGFLSFG